MVEYTRAATWRDLITVIGFLNDAQVEYALVGGYALIAHGLNRASEDIDILVEPSAENATRWVMALSQLPDGVAADLAGETDLLAEDVRYGIRINDEITIDVLGTVCGQSWEDLKSYRTFMIEDGVRIPLLNLEGLLRTKQGLRERDKMDALMLQMAIEHLKNATPKKDPDRGPSP